MSVPLQYESDESLKAMRDSYIKSLSQIDEELERRGLKGAWSKQPDNLQTPDPVRGGNFG